MPSFDPIEFARKKLVMGVRGVFNDTQRGETPVPPSDEAYFAKDTPIRMVHADVVSMMVGGMAALLLQMLHPHALRGVLDFSNFRADMHGRLRRTARFIAVTTYGQREEADKAIARVNAIHSKVEGTLPDGTPYSATNPRTLAWVHVTESLMFLEAWLTHVQPDMPMAEQDEYFRQFALVARRLGAEPVPETKAEALAIFRAMRTDLHAGPDAREVAQLIINRKIEGATGAVQPFLANAAVDLIPPFARTMLALKRPGWQAGPSKLVTDAMGGTLRWAFRQRPHKSSP
ncbi:oxygenase MpaB family protein [Aurantiacibacter poecillastricola]|uniref:oxygenase MpaB family protein n=1 Tax=Aurantiacibacter poecillastricola TaxID=3064385 RepID=UPI00273D440F|nr:oxygenase MpaB family protein [Aurantiacibacter sp. 219JJ12-13]MDP5262518.1 oxygenase MpaB family protein [Aurantiacibacter sp. 219JJ12-13]